MTAHSIMIAEPDLIVAKGIERWLHAQGHMVTAITTSGAALREAAGENPPDLLLINATLKFREDGIFIGNDLAESLDVPYILLATFPDEILKATEKGAGFSGYLVKPFSEQDVLLAVATALSRNPQPGIRTHSGEPGATIAAVMDTAIIVTDRNHRISYMNPIAARLTGFPAEETLGIPVSRVLKISEPGESMQYYQPGTVLGNPKKNRENTKTLISRDGRKYPIFYKTASWQDQPGEVHGVIHVFRDITDLIAAERECVEVQKRASLGVLAGGIAHELNNILTAMNGYLSLCRRTIPDGKGIAYFDEMEEQLFRIRDVARQLVTFTPGGAPVKEIVSIKGIIETAVKATAGLPGIRHTLLIPEDLWKIEADENQITIVFRNLILNAAHAMGDRGTIRISASNRIVPVERQSGPGHVVAISIADTGTGIGNELLKKIFDPFVTTKYGSAGIGLTVASSIVEQHGGEIKVESEPGTGSVFHVLLPAKDTTA